MRMYRSHVHSHTLCDLYYSPFSLLYCSLYVAVFQIFLCIPEHGYMYVYLYMCMYVYRVVWILRVCVCVTMQRTTACVRSRPTDIVVSCVYAFIFVNCG